MDAASEQVIRPQSHKRKYVLKDDSESEDSPSAQSSPPSSVEESCDDFRPGVLDEDDDDGEEGERDELSEAAPASRSLTRHGGKRKVTWNHAELYSFLKYVERHEAYRQRPDQKRRWARVLEDLTSRHSLPDGIDNYRQLSKKLNNLLACKRDPIKEPPFKEFVPSTSLFTDRPSTKKEIMDAMNASEANHAREQQRLRDEAEEMRSLLHKFRLKPIGEVHELVATSNKKSKRTSTLEQENEILESIAQQRNDKKELAVSKWQRAQAAAEAGISSIVILLSLHLFQHH